MSNVRVSASLLSADPLRLHEEAASVTKAGAHLLHLDVMDGHFVPPLTYGAQVAESLHKEGFALDIHLMVDCLDSAVRQFAPYATYLTVHVEATRHLHRVLQDIRRRGCMAGVALNPGTGPEFLPQVMAVTDLVLVMAVNPGWGGQKCIREMMPKVSWVKSLAEKEGRDIAIEVDGGVTGENAAAFVRAGANILVSGSYLFAHEDRREAVLSLLGA